jgi:hypothetical protein
VSGIDVTSLCSLGPLGQTTSYIRGILIKKADYCPGDAVRPSQSLNCVEDYLTLIVSVRSRRQADRPHALKMAYQLVPNEARFNASVPRLITSSNVVTLRGAMALTMDAFIIALHFRNRAR